MRCLNLKVTYECSNRCSFCFSSYLNDCAISEYDLTKTLVEGRQKGCEGIVFSGGEPTLSRSLVNLLKLSKELNYKKCIIQTNGKGLVDDGCDLVQYLHKYSQKIDSSISFSIHGSTQEIHEKMTGTIGSFECLMSAIKNIYRTSCSIYTNTVISNINKSDLIAIIELIMPYNPTIMQFAVMHIQSGGNSLAPALIDSLKAILALKGRIKEDVLRTEGIPYCLMRSMEACVGESYWPTTLDICNSTEKYFENFDQLASGMRYKPAQCQECIFDKLCKGIWYEHREEFDSLNVLPIK